MKMMIHKRFICPAIFQLTAFNSQNRMIWVLILVTIIGCFHVKTAYAAQLKAGVAKINITNLEQGGFVKDSVYARILVLDDGSTSAVIVSIDAIKIGPFLDTVRMELQKELKINSSNVMINASQLHTARADCPDLAKRIIKGVKEAWRNRVTVNAGTGKGFEDRIMENRRLILKNGKEWTIRHANPLPPDEEVAGVGPVDPEIGILRLDRKDGRPLAVLYNFTCHPYQDSRQDKIGWQELGTTADFPGYASRVIENNLGDNTVALFLQGCDGNITTVLYKDVNNPRDAEPLGNMLGLSTLKALKNIKTKSTAELKIINETIELPLRKDVPQRIDSLEAEQAILLRSLRGMSLNMKSFIPLYIKYNLYPDYPSYYSHRYMVGKITGRKDLEHLDTENRRNMDKYLHNILAMEKLSRIQENLSLLERLNDRIKEIPEETIKAEVTGIRIGDFVMITFPGEALVEVGLSIKKMSPFENTFISGHTNGNLGYAPATAQFKGEAYEDLTCRLAPEWQKTYEETVMEILKKL
jgi:hypothetical protein